MTLSTDIDHGEEGLDTERVCQDCPAIIIPDTHYPFRRRCYSCFMVAMDALLHDHNDRT